MINFLGPVWFFLYFFILQQIRAQVCPPMGADCTCESNVYEPVSVNCKGISTLSQALGALSSAQGTTIDRLVIQDTPINSLPARAFSGLRIISLELKNCQINQISPQAFTGTPLIETLIELSFENNNLGSIPTQGITELRNLRKLILKRNGIAVVEPRAFMEYASRTGLEKLDLSENRISGIGTVSLEGLTNLKELSFEKNLFTAIPSQGLRPVRETLEDLNLGLNQITDVPVGALDLPALKSLSLEFNGIQFIGGESFRGVPNLLYLYLGGNKFNRWDPGTFRNVPKLLVLGMGEMSIQQIPSNAFQYITNLERLEMSNAAVSDIQQGAFQRVAGSIRDIILDYNELTRYFMKKILESD